MGEIKQLPREAKSPTVEIEAELDWVSLGTTPTTWSTSWSTNTRERLLQVGTYTPPPSVHRSPETSTRTRQRLWGIEEELERAHRMGPTPTSQNTRQKLRQAEERAQKAEVLANRLKHEANVAAAGFPGDAGQRLSDLKRAESEAASRMGKRSTAGMLKAVCSTDLLFLIDATSSMRPYIEAVKDQVRAIIRIAVVGYRDSDRPNVEFLDFTTSVSAVHSFLKRLTTRGGGDRSEDTRCIIHIADAPPHGRTLHDYPRVLDSYAIPGSEPHGLAHQSLLPRMVSLRINYVLLRINSSTDRMAYTFLQAYGFAAGDGALLPTNKYSSYLLLKRGRGAGDGLLFREAELGTTFAELRTLVAKAVTASASRTATRHVNRQDNITPRRGSGFTAVHNVPLDSSPPQWDSESWFDESFILHGFSLKAIVRGATTLDKMMSTDDNIGMSNPFAQGSPRLAFYASTMASTSPCVVKTSKRTATDELPLLVEEMRCRALAKSFALEFNSLLHREHTIDFVATACFKGHSKSADDDSCISLKPFIEGIHDSPANQAAQAFSHFTFERSKGKFLVCDLQGAGEFLTDPVVHTADENRFKLSRTNVGFEGMKLFFMSHECNDVCSRLELRSSRSTIKSDTPIFRETWPPMADAVCCPNKMCERILRRNEANSLARYLGYHWCKR
ncbi:hypothetical protein QBC38DRAFT_508680 [Podospora fimiseda]|uniref:Alpha-type protein kinase domain-containing protein n=1 Tax=Podospora fimiseda TaxID=252190 RepID=A0AAN7BSM4_9PEZI|nr:hypothetical protein QBC38DRAFT_508680 [Podospora fimiseda]